MGKFLTKNLKDDIIKSEEVKSLEQAKKRNHKIYITDIAIGKITKSEIKNLSDEQNKYIDYIHKKLLIKSQKENNSNEVAYIFNLTILKNNEEIFELGSENSVNIFNNPLAVAESHKNNNLFLAHNHPSTMNFSYSDLGVFLLNDCLKGISVVSNTGDVHILYKTDKYNFIMAFEFMNKERRKHEFYNADVDKRIVDAFLKNSYKFGIVQF